MNHEMRRSLDIGTVLRNKWVILEFIGKGAMGEVYRAHQLNLKRDTAIKVISSEWLATFDDDQEEIETTCQRFRREVEVMASIRHPNVVQIIDYDSASIKKGDEDVAIEYIAMEYIPGNTLRSTMSEEGFYPDEDATKAWLVNYFLPVLGGVQAMHSVRIVHRDLKPENVLLDGNKPKIADFGLARSGRFRSFTQSVDSKGTPPYMSPEQFSDFKRTDERADIYSLGKILYEAIDGKMTSKVVPFHCASLEKAETPFFKKLDEIVCGATAEDKEQRLRSVRLFRNALVEAVDTLAGERRTRTSQRFRRELTAILSADVQGYSRLMEKDETATIQTLTEYREVLLGLIEGHHGRMVDSVGDNVLAEFVSVVDAVACAAEIQETLEIKNADLPEDRRMNFRIGINLGDIVKEGDQVYGDGVNIAARIEGLAEGGGICISRNVYDQVKNALSLNYEYLGEHTVKNITEPVRVYRVRLRPGADAARIGHIGTGIRRWQWKTLISAMVLILVGGAVWVWKSYLGQQMDSPSAEAPAHMKTAVQRSDKLSTTALPKNKAGPVSAVEPYTREAETSSDQSPDRLGHLSNVSDGPTDDQYAATHRDHFPNIEAHPPLTVLGEGGDRQPLEARKGKMQDKVGGVPEKILSRQSAARVKVPSIESAFASALKAAQEAASRLIDMQFHKGRRLVVPDDFKTIQSAIDAGKRGDVVVVRAGRYFESIVMKDGVKLVSDVANGGNNPVPVEGGQLKLPERTFRTIIDGSKAKGSSYWIIDFHEGVGRNTIVDGFTIENLPVQGYHILTNAYAINVRGGSPVIMNSCIRKNGGTGIGNHVSYKPTKMRLAKPKSQFEVTDVKEGTEPVIYRNVVCQNLGPGIECNDFTAPHILGNEVFLNVFPYSAEVGEKPSPGIGTKCGAAPTLIGNIVHEHPGGGILCDAGKPKDMGGTIRFSSPSIEKNVVYRNGEHGPSILCSGGGKEVPIRCVGNWVYDAGWIGIDFSKDAVCIVEDNVVSGTKAPGIRVNGATLVRLNRNEVTGASGPGFLIKNGGKVLEMVANASDLNKGPRFMLRDSTISDPDA